MTADPIGHSHFSELSFRDRLKKAGDRQKGECKRPEYGEKRLLAFRRSLGEPTFDARWDFSYSFSTHSGG